MNIYEEVNSIELQDYDPTKIEIALDMSIFIKEFCNDHKRAYKIAFDAYQKSKDKIW